MKYAPLLALLVACSSSKPDGLAVEYHWREGSMPPPYHYEYDITISADGKGRIAFRPDYGAQPEWVEEFAVADMAKLRKIVDDAGVFTKTWTELKDPPVGGAYAWLKATSDGKTVEVPSHPTEPGRLAEVYAAIHDSVPRAIWDSLAARREQYSKDK